MEKDRIQIKTLVDMAGAYLGSTGFTLDNAIDLSSKLHRFAEAHKDNDLVYTEIRNAVCNQYRHNWDYGDPSASEDSFDIGVSGSIVLVTHKKSGLEKGFRFDVPMKSDPRRKVINYLKKHNLKPSIINIQTLPWLREIFSNIPPACEHPECQVEIENLTTVSFTCDPYGYHTFCSPECRLDYININKTA